MASIITVSDRIAALHAWLTDYDLLDGAVATIECGHIIITRDGRQLARVSPVGTLLGIHVHTARGVAHANWDVTGAAGPVATVCRALRAA